MDDHQSNDASSGTTSNGSFRWNRYCKFKRNVVYFFIKPLNCIVNIGIPPIILSFYNLFKLFILPSCLAFYVYICFLFQFLIKFYLYTRECSTCSSFSFTFGNVNIIITKNTFLVLIPIHSQIFPLCIIISYQTF